MARYRFFEKIVGSVSILILILGWGFPAFSQEKSINLARLMHADSLIFQKKDGQEIFRFMGNVVFEKGFKSLTCDQSVYYRQQAFAIFTGKVVMNDSGRILRADEVIYYQRPEREIARGHVRFTNGKKELASNLLKYSDVTQKALATQNVVFRDSLNSIELFADSLIYWVDKDYGEARGNPKLIRRDSTGAVEVEIQSRKLAYDGNKSVAVALKDVKITRGDVISFAAIARYYNSEDKIVITGKPKVYQREDTMTADSIEIFIHGKHLERVHLIGHGRMSSKRHLHQKILEDWLSGQDIWMSFKEDTLREVTVQDQAISLYHVIEDGKEKGINQVLGDWLKIQFQKGDVKKVIIKSTPGRSRGKFYPPGAKVQPLKP
ncbi:MAG: hypothetical protein GXO76_07410 [Calditrichaeota bacterium]|nr:hypothetical protein [Calditrichota bacterium]